MSTGIPSVFDVELPTIDYSGAQGPDEAQAILAPAREQSPIAIGPHGPEVLTYDLAHEVLRDPRFRMPQGMFLVAQGITSGPVWDRVSSSIISIDGPEHSRLRRLVATAFSRRHRYHPQPGRRLGPGPVRTPRPMGLAGRPSRPGRPRCRGDRASLADCHQHAEDGPRGR